MNITLERAENAVKWGQAGFSLALALLSLIHLGVSARNGKSKQEER
ncbi:MAG: hypothetical protein V3U24_10690 [Candidatus Neomarinimicrobiota bacterium]